MAKEVQRRGGTAADHASFTGADREWTHDDTIKGLRVHDGTTLGGFPIFHEGYVEAATDSATDAYQFSARRQDVPVGDTVTADIQSANTTPTPTLENTDGASGALTVTTRDGSALWAGALSGVHTFQRAASSWLVLDPKVDTEILVTDNENLSSLSYDAEISAVARSAINTRHIVIDENFAYAVNMGTYDGTDQGTVDIFNISDPQNLSLVNTINVGAVGDGPRAIEVAGDYLFVGTFTGQELFVYDIADRKNPSLVNQVAAGESLHALEVNGRYLYSADWGTGIQVWNIANPRVPSIVSSIALTGAQSASLARDGTVLFAPSSTDPGTLYVVDVHDVPSILGSVSTVSNARHVVYGNNVCYVGGPATSSYVSVIDVSDRTAPTEITQIALSGTVHSLELLGDRLVIASRDTDENYVYDVTDPSSPSLERTYSKSFTEIVAKGQWIFGMNIGDGPQGSHPSDDNQSADFVSYLWDQWSRRAGYYRSLQTGQHVSDRVIAGDVRAKSLTVGGRSSSMMALRAVGEYTGDGTTSNSITNLGFRPVYVKIWRNTGSPDTDTSIHEATTVMLNNANFNAVQHITTGGHKTRSGSIVSFDENGFTVSDNGSDSDPNTSGFGYSYLAIG